MPSLTWPSSIPAPHLPLSESFDDPAIRTEMEGGYTNTRPRYTRIRGTWPLKWNALTETHYNTLKNFYKNDTFGGSLFFSWTTPTDESTVNVRFTKKYAGGLLVPSSGTREAIYHVEVELEEV
jgi:hypothetical protein